MVVPKEFHQYFGAGIELNEGKTHFGVEVK